MTTSTQARANRAKGIRYERAVSSWLTLLGIPSTRTSTGRRQDDGDLSNTLGLYVECKDVGRLNLAGWLDEARARARDAGSTAVVFVKRRGRAHVGESYAVLAAADLLALLGVTEPTTTRKEHHP